MAREGPKVAVQKPVRKVNKQYPSNYTPYEEPDHLSYSYSCLKSFKKNQHILRDLLKVRQGQFYGQPMFSFSRSEVQPVHNKSTDSECGQISSYKFGYKESVSDVEQNLSSKLSNIDLEPDFREIIDKNLLYKWLKHQFKCVHSLWPFSMPKDSICSKFSNKSRTMKMEVFLSNVDEKTKCRLKTYVNNLDLSLEERSSLCNESLIEIDITPILADDNRLQEFLAFIHSIESNSPSSMADNSKLDKKQIQLAQNQIIQDGCTKKHNDNKAKKDISSDIFKIDKKNYKTKINEPASLSVECLYISPGKGDMADLEKNVRKPTKNNDVLNTQTLKCGRKNKYLLKVNPTTRKCSVSNVVKSSSSSILNSKVKTNKTSNFVQKPRLNSTIPAKGQMHGKNDNNEMLTEHIQQESNQNHYRPHKLLAFNTKLNRFYQEKQSVDPDGVNRCVTLDNKTYSCKCLMHLEREDYKRYQNQCLFGKGESYNLRKYVSFMEKKSKLKVHPVDSSSFECVNDDSKESDTETTSSQESDVVNNKIKTDQHKKIDTFGSETTLSSTSTQSDSHYLHQTGLQNDFETMKIKVPEKYQICSTTISKVEEKYKNKIKVRRSSSNDTSKKVTKCKSTEKVNSSSQTLVFNDYRVIHIKDVEELVCEVSYSDTSCKTNSSKTNVSCKSSDISCANIIEKILNQESTNACFESLNYSISSTPGETITDIFKRESSVQVSSNDSSTNRQNKKETSSFKKALSLGASLNKLKYFETNKKTLEDKRESPQSITNKSQNLKAQYIGEKVDYVKICHERENNFRRKRTSHSMKVQRRSFIKNQTGREQKSMGEHTSTVNEKENRANCLDGDKVSSRISILENNTRELQRKITELIDQLQLINTKQKELEITKPNCGRNGPVSPYKVNKARLVINIDDTGKQSGNILSIQKSNKKCLHFMKPQKIYNSISTIFKRSVENNTNSKKGKVPKSFDDDGSSGKPYLETECHLSKNFLDFENSKPIDKNPSCSTLNKQNEYYLILSNLDTLNTELRLQNKEIQILKEYLYNIKN